MSHDSLLKKFACSVLPPLLGAVVGGACILSYSSSHATPAATVASADESAPRVTVRAERERADSARSEQRPDTRSPGRPAIAERGSDGDDHDDHDVEDQERPDREQAVADDHEEFQGRLAKHRSERQDATWAGPAQASFGGQLVELGESGGFSVGAVDCRSSTCSAALAWPSLEIAMGSMESIATASYDTNCMRTVHLSEGMEGGSEVRGTVLFECPRDRG